MVKQRFWESSDDKSTTAFQDITNFFVTISFFYLEEEEVFVSCNVVEKTYNNFNEPRNTKILQSFGEYRNIQTLQISEDIKSLLLTDKKHYIDYQIKEEDTRAIINAKKDNPFWMKFCLTPSLIN